MTSNTAPQGLASASSENATANAAWKAMDKLSSTFWRTTSAGKTPCNLNYTFIIPQVIDKYTVTASTTTNTAPNAWKFQGRLGSTWTDLDTQTGITFTSNETKSYTFTNPTAYWEYRILVSANNGGTYTEIAELEMMATIAGHVKVPSLNLQTEILANQARVVSLNLQTEVMVPKVKIPSLNLQVEVIPIEQTSRLKKYVGGEWVPYPLKIYSGGAWVEKPLKFYNGSEWVS